MDTLLYLVDSWLNLVDSWSYPGIFLTTMIESTFVPMPAELTMIPAGILAAQGELNYWGVLVSSTAGVVVGSIINYWIGYRFGRTLLEKYGKYVFIKHDFLEKTEAFFEKYGAFAVFIGRLLIGIRHYIGFVAGIARFKFKSFVVYTSIGGLLWMFILLQIGYLSEKTAESSYSAVTNLQIIIVLLTIISVIAYGIKLYMMKD